jgi:phosphoribosylamine--glycine ligase
MKILVIGSGGREHAICWAISKSKLLDKLYAIPGNAGISQIATTVDIAQSDFHSIKEFCFTEKINIVFVGPEQPLCDGLTEFLEKENISVIGCDSYVAQLESSKAFTKKICDKAGIKTASYEVFHEASSAISYIDSQNKYPTVIKADGLAAGKGVIIAEDFNQAREAIEDIFSGKFGKMDKLVIEQFLTGVEASLFAISDGENFKLLSCAGDHKRIGDGDKGPNTGGMGTYSPSPFVTEAIEKEVVDEILIPTFEQLKKEGHPYKGVIFAGLMINDQNEPYLIEYNIRFGDPETQSILARLETDFLEICQAVIDESLDELEINFSDQKSVTLVISAKGYPESYRKGTIIDLEKIDRDEVNIFHAGTKIENENLVANGGRVLNLTALGNSFTEACTKVYKAAEQLDWEDKYYRKDIAKKVL